VLAVGGRDFSNSLFALGSFSSRLSGSGLSCGSWSIVLGSRLSGWERFILLLFISWASERFDLVNVVLGGSALVLFFWLRLLGGSGSNSWFLGLCLLSSWDGCRSFSSFSSS
jgi:hypothetical protein